MTAVIFAIAIFMVIQMVLQYNKIHYGDVWIADLYVKTVDTNGNPIWAYIMLSEPYDTGWKVIKEKPITASGTFEYVGSFSPTIVSGKQYRIDAMASGMKMMGTVTVNLVKGRNDITIVLTVV